ncbi:thioredoxin domain-containing protein [Candidatus Micrarchaeota archaeon]|nr:thioredoxin domain-containing protein [Candidatus Micrarchaeota archaeon]
MVLCFVALFVFGILGIFSAKYRILAKEALGCVFRTVTLRPCESKLDERLHAQIVAKLLPIFPAGARVIHKNFQLFSLLLVVLFFGSMISSGISVYNYWAYGNCNGPNSSEYCVFDAVLGAKGPAGLKFLAPGVGPTLGNGSFVMVEAGCFTCPFTNKTQPELSAFLQKHPEVTLEFRAFPIPTHANSTLAAQAAFCAQAQGKFWPYYDLLFTRFGQDSREDLLQNAATLGLNQTAFAQCLDSNATLSRVQKDVEAGKAAGIYGTPTFFINGSALVGPQSVSQFEAGLAGTAPKPFAGQGGVCPPPASVLAASKTAA